MVSSCRPRNTGTSEPDLTTKHVKKLIEYAQDPSNGIWIAPVGTVAKCIQDQKKLNMLFDNSTLSLWI